LSNFNAPVERYMSSPAHSIRAHEDLEDAYDRLRELEVSSLAVVSDDDGLVGVISMTDLIHIGRIHAGSSREAALLTLPKRPVSKEMTSDVVTVSPQDSVRVAAQKMVDSRIHRVFVEDAGRPVGVLSTKDVMLAIRDTRVATPIHRWMSSPAFTVRASEPISLATDRLERAHVSGLIVTDDDWPVGLFTQREALLARDRPRDTRIDEVMSAAMLALDIETPLHRAAAQAAELRVRRIIVVKGRSIEGILTGLDLSRAVARSGR
jgi:signal-transduction protein with cAMP-binding, CBS, and nucleotidyltransferase domain